MNTLSNNLYELLALGVGEGGWQSFVDHYAEKYDSLVIDGFDFAPTQINYTWQQLVSSTGAATLPAYVDPESPGYEAALRSAQGLSGNIPTQKKFYRLNRVIVREKMQLLQLIGDAAVNQDMIDAVVGLIDEGTDGLIKSYYNALTYQRMQIVSTGQFTINAENNPRGLRGITVKFGIDDDHFDTIAGTSRWWTSADHSAEGSASDPVKYMKDRIKYIRRTKHFVGAMHIEISSSLYDDLLTHSKVLSRIGHSLYPNVTDDATVIANAKNYSDEALKQILERIVGMPIVERDAYAYVDAPGTNSDGDPDLVTTQIESFNAKNIAFVPDGKIGSFQGVQPLTLGYDEDKVARFDGGRLVLTQRANPDTHSLYIESEAAQLAVPSVPQGMFISTVTA